MIYYEPVNLTVIFYFLVHVSSYTVNDYAIWNYFLHITTNISWLGLNDHTNYSSPYMENKRDNL